MFTELEDKLKSCPFCNGKAKIEYNYEHDDDYYCVVCSECGVIKGYVDDPSTKNIEGLVNSWNERV